MKRNLIALYCSLLTAAGAAAFSAPASIYAAQDRFSCTTQRDASNNILVDFTEVELTLPADWSGKCQVSTSDSYASFYQIKSRKLLTQELGMENGGHLFTLCFSENLDFLDLPSYRTVGNTQDGYYYVSFPTDVQYYIGDAAAEAEYLDMSNDIDTIISSIRIKDGYAATSFSNTSDYILPQSSTARLTEAELRGLTGDQLQMAINEIYARHHRKFAVDEVRAYFESKSWYSGYVEPGDFDTSVMNSYETYNIDLILSYMKQNGLTSSIGQKGGSGSSSDDSRKTETVEAYGTIITKGDNYFILQQPDGTTIQFWYEPAKIAQMDASAANMKAGLSATITYDANSYEALNIIIW